jgi:hypothetical protein
VSEFAKSAQESLILINNYVDESVLILFLKRKENVDVKIYTAKLSTSLKTDFEKHNKQYPPIEIKVYKNAHDRFLIIYDKQVYHIGAFLKDLGKKLFGCSKMEMDADFSHSPKDLVRLYDACKNGNADVAVGSRYITGVNVVNWPMGRVLLSYYASKYVRIITGMKIKDTTAGFVCYNIDVLKAINLKKIRMIGYAFQIEMKFKAVLHGFNVVEVPIIFTDRKLGASKMSGGIFSEAVFGVLRMKLQSMLSKKKFLS